MFQNIVWNRLRLNTCEIFPWFSGLAEPGKLYTWGMGPGNKFVSTQYFATLLKATAFKAVVFTRKSVGTDVVGGGLCVLPLNKN